MSLPDYPIESQYFDRGGGVRMHYIDEGPRDGPPVVMLHGNPTWSFYYRRLISGLRETHRCIAPDHVGMGLSDKPKDKDYAYTLASRIDDADALLEHLGVRENITLVLHDWGGMIGMGYAARHPGRIARLVILNTAAFHLPTTTRIPWRLRLGRGVLGPLLIRGFNAFCRGAAKRCVTRRPLSADARLAYLEPYDSWKNRIAVLRFVQDIPLRPGGRAYDTVSAIEAALPQFAGRPMLIAWGMRDFVFNEHFLHEWERRFPQAAVHRFDDAGHYILEDAHEQIVPLVRAFVR